jgi:hypothetical protein
VLETDVILITNELGGRIKVAEIFDSVDRIKDQLSSREIQFVAQGCAEDLVVLNTRIRTELGLSTTVMDVEQLRSLANDQQAVQSSFVLLGSGELFDIASCD